jgi:ATP phosphoribosyltransferase
MSAELVFSRSIIPPSSINAESGSQTEEFRDLPFKFALQKNGELTSISTSIFQETVQFPIETYIDQLGRQLFCDIEGVGVVLAKNKAICQLVAHGSIDAGIVGLDQVFESGLKDKLIIAKEYQHKGNWDIVLATPIERAFQSLYELYTIASQYPIIAKAYFDSVMHYPKIIPTQGSTEVMPLLTHEDAQIDGVVDLRVSGSTLFANGLIPWNPPLTTVYPVLIVNENAINNPIKRSYVERFI